MRGVLLLMPILWSAACAQDGSVLVAPSSEDRAQPPAESLGTLTDALGGAGLVLAWDPRLAPREAWDAEAAAAAVWDTWEAARAEAIPLVILIPFNRSEPDQGDVVALCGGNPSLTSRALWRELRSRIYWLPSGAGAVEWLGDDARYRLFALDESGSIVGLYPSWGEGAAGETVAQAATDLRRVAATPREILVYLQGDGAAASGTAYVTPDARRSAGRIHLRPSPVGGDVALRGVGAVSGQAESLFLWIEGYAGGIPLPVSEEMAVSAGAWEFDLRDRDRDALTIRSDVACPEGLLELSPVADTEWVVPRALGQPVFPFLPPGRYELRLRCLGARVGSVEVDMDEGPMSLELTELGGGAFLFREITIVLDVPSAWHDAAFFAWGQFREAGGDRWSDKLPVALEPIAQDRLGGRLTLPAARPVRVGLRMGEDRELATRELPPDPAGTELVFEWSSIGPALGGGQEASVRRAPGIELAPLSSGGGLAVGEEGRVYATDPARGQVVAYEPEPLSPGWPWAGQGSLPGQLDEPAGVAVSEGGIVYVADSGNDRVQAFDGQGKFLRSFGGRGAGEGRLRAPSDVAIGPGGDLYVCDRGNDLIQVFTADGMFLRQWGESGRAPGQLSGPSSVAVASTGAVYVSDTGSHRIQTFDPMGNLLESWGGAGDGPGGLDSPTGIALDGQRNLWVADTGNQRLQVFGPSGEAKIIDLSAYGLKDPMDVALSPVDGTVWVISADGRIQGLAGPSKN